MLSHETIWKAIDTLAERHQLTASGLARKAGLDPTSFNKSKRLGPDGRLRWPSTESISKVLDATGATVEQFLSYLPNMIKETSLPEGAFPPQTGSIPLLGFAQAGAGGFFDDGGFPPARAGTWWIFRWPPRGGRVSTRSRCRANPCCRSTGMATG